jgi:hypothetical protein
MQRVTTRGHCRKCESYVRVPVRAPGLTTMYGAHFQIDLPRSIMKESFWNVSNVFTTNIRVKDSRVEIRPIDEAHVIIGMSTIQDQGAGFRTRLFTPRWNFLKERLAAIELKAIPALDARMIIGHVESKRTIVGIEGPSFVVETRIPIEEFKQLSIGEKNDLVLDTIFESIKAAYAHFGDEAPPEINRIWQDARAIGK